MIEALAPFGDTIKICVPPDLNQRVEDLKKCSLKFLESAKQWSSSINIAVASWLDIKENLGKWCIDYLIDGI